MLTTLGAAVRVSSSTLKNCNRSRSFELRETGVNSHSYLQVRWQLNYHGLGKAYGVQQNRGRATLGTIGKKQRSNHHCPFLNRQFHYMRTLQNTIKPVVYNSYYSSDVMIAILGQVAASSLDLGLAWSGP